MLKTAKSQVDQHLALWSKQEKEKEKKKIHQTDQTEGKKPDIRILVRMSANSSCGVSSRDVEKPVVQMGKNTGGYM